METNQEKNKTQLSVLPDIVQPLMSADDAVIIWKKFEELKSKLLSEDDYQQIGGKRFIKRSGFRKIGVFFGLSDRLLKEERSLVEKDDKKGFVWRIVVEAVAPNGRSSVGVGACDSTERKFAHEEHDVYATAHTRAKSRAISDLIAGGLLSAEEMDATMIEPPRRAPSPLTEAPPKPPMQPQSSPSTTSPLPPKKSSIEELNADVYAGVELLPWINFQTKQPSLPEEDGWVFRDKIGAEDLAAGIDEAQSRGVNGILVNISGHIFVCRFSGEDNTFINRNRFVPTQA